MRALSFVGGTVAAAVLLFASVILPPPGSLGYHPEYWTWMALGFCIAGVVALLALGLRWAAAGVATGLVLTVGFWATVVALIIHDGGLD